MKHYPDAGEERRGPVTAYFTGLDADAVAKLPPSLPGVVLPPESRFEAVLVDVTTGREYPATYAFCNLEHETETWWDADVDELVAVRTLNRHMMAHHWCGCHRRDDIVGDKPDMPGCEGNRLLVRSLTHPALPGVNLMREE